MRRALGGLGLVVHGLAHALPGAQAGAAGRSWLLSAIGIPAGPLRWIVALLSSVAMAGFVAAGFGVWRTPPFRSRWRPSAVVAAGASVALLVLFWLNAYGVAGLAIDAAVLGLLWPPPAEETVVEETPTRARRVVRAAATVAAVAFVGWLGLISVTAPFHRFWGSEPEELTMALPGDNPLPGGPTYWIQHAVTIDAPVEAVWPWLAQLGTDRGGFYSYDFLERAFGFGVRNADRVHPEWQDVHEGRLVMAARAGFLGIDHPIGWKVTGVVQGRAMVLENWGAFVLVPVDVHTTRFIVRTRNGQPPNVMGLAMAWFGLVTFEPVHFVMERRMLLGVKERAEHRVGWATPLTPPSSAATSPPTP